MKTESHQFVTTALPNQNSLTIESKNDTFGRYIPIDRSRALINWPSMSPESKNPLIFWSKSHRTIKSERERLAVSHWPWVGNDSTENTKPSKNKNWYKTRTCLRV